MFRRALQPDAVAVDTLGTRYPPRCGHCTQRKVLQFDPHLSGDGRTNHGAVTQKPASGDRCVAAQLSRHVIASPTRRCGAALTTTGS